MSTVNYKAHLTGFLRQATDFYINDLRVLTQDQYSNSPGGCARAPHDFTAEVAGINTYMARRVLDPDAQRATDDERADMLAQVATLESGVEAIRVSSEALLAAIESADDAILGAEMMAPWGAPTTVYAMCHLCASHVMYHDAQLNYLQGLSGDDQMHWFE